MPFLTACQPLHPFTHPSAELPARPPGNSIEWSDLPPESLQRRWRELTFPLLLPVYLALRLTIPFADPASYSRRWLLATCAAAPLLAAVYLAPSAAAALPMMIAAAVAGGALAAAVGYFTAGGS